MISWITVEEVVPLKIRAALVPNPIRPDNYKVSMTPKSVGIGQEIWAPIFLRVLESVRSAYPWLTQQRDAREHFQTYTMTFHDLATKLIAEIMEPQESATDALSTSLAAAGLCPVDQFRLSMVPADLPGGTIEAWEQTLTGACAKLLLPAGRAAALAKQTHTRSMAEIIAALIAPPPTDTEGPVTGGHP